MSARAERFTRQCRRGIALGVLLASGAAAALLFFWPSGDAIRSLHIALWTWTWRLIGAPAWFTPEVSEAIANTVVIAVPTAALIVVLDRVPAWRIVAVACLIGVAVELAQGLLLPGRSVNWVDAASNAIGAVIGGVVGIPLRARGDARARPPAEAAGELAPEPLRRSTL